MRLHAGVAAAVLALAGGGCTSVKMVQRDGCWVRRTEKPLGRVYEEVGPCDRAEPRWAKDRLTRLVQECMAQADWRWHARALEVWSRGLPYPTPQPREDTLLRTCMEETRTGMKVEDDAARLKDRIGDLSGRVAELSGERDALRGDAARERDKLEAREDRLAEWLGTSHGKLSDWLGKAALKPPGNATATASSTSTSDGKATTSSDGKTTLASTGGAPPGGAPVSSASVVLPPGATAAPAAPGPVTVAEPAPPQDARPPAKARPAPPPGERGHRASARAKAPRAVPPCPVEASAGAAPGGSR